jgi:dynein heavy chain
MAENYNFSESGVYKSTSKLELDDIRTYINTFPLEDEPEVFGLHNNANITF